MTDVIRKDGRLRDGSACWAIFSADDRHRFMLSRTFDEARPGYVLWLMLNPSTATHEVSDPTLTRCVGFTKAWGYGTFRVANLFSLRSTDPRALKLDVAPEGDPLNAVLITEAARDAAIVVCGWGVHGSLRNRAATVLASLHASGLHSKLHALDVTKEGHPKHPLYLRGDLTPRPYAHKEKAA